MKNSFFGEGHRTYEGKGGKKGKATLTNHSYRTQDDSNPIIGVKTKEDYNDLVLITGPNSSEGKERERKAENPHERSTGKTGREGRVAGDQKRRREQEGEKNQLKMGFYHDPKTSRKGL